MASPVTGVSTISVISTLASNITVTLINFKRVEADEETCSGDQHVIYTIDDGHLVVGSHYASQSTVSVVFLTSDSPRLGGPQVNDQFASESFSWEMLSARNSKLH